jgi:hypothetical protein
MNITIAEIEEQFNKWNGIIFNDELPTPHFELCHTKSFLGQFQWREVLGTRTYKIRISNFYDRPFEYFVDTIVHEMLHYYIKYNNIKDTSSHGRVWKKYAADINKKYGLNIARTNPTGGGISEAILEKKRQKKDVHETVIVCTLRDGRYGAAVLPPTKVSALIPRFAGWNYVVSYSVVRAPWAETFNLRHLRTRCGIRTIKKEIYDELLKNPKLRV